MSSLPPSLHDLLETKLDAFEKVDIVLALWDAPSETLAVPILGEKLGYDRDAIREAVMALRAAKLVEQTSTGQVRLCPSAGDRALLEMLATHHRDRTELANVLSTIALEKIRVLASRYARRE